MIREGIIGGGSSPLARGLPEVLVDLVHGPGIIPARAGFTNRHSRCRTHAQDHPRSRGVYASVACASAFAAGSSPLARGLQDQEPDRRKRRRIIPARAGFTSMPTRRRPAARDHPRSRGVYGLHAHISHAEIGSSPLARGLPRAGRRCRSTSGIIPARAGFTKAFERRGPVASDHPRSRGVYTEYVVGDTWREGSSPLARGLRRHPDRRRRRPGIIPARAGFTRSPLSRSLGWRDHPRSRGVYTRRQLSRMDDLGSSPLARGLLQADVLHRVRGRIIPARAGFTGSGRASGSTRWDHPRSRGVYEAQREHIVAAPGSSPLARGLHDDKKHRRFSLRIIPARAGFTSTRAAPRIMRWDHPRSRGVYSICSGATAARNGSSPLARGLRGPVYTPETAAWIIPARAGFTPTAPTRRMASADHPRSRGVYVSPAATAPRG